MPNKGAIDLIISPEARAQLTEFTGLIVNARGELTTTVGVVNDLNNAISKSKSIKEYEQNTTKASKAINDMALSSIKLEAATIKLEQTKQKIATDTIKRLEKEQAAENAKTKIIVSNSQAEVDAYNKSTSGAGKLGVAVNDLERQQAAAANSASQLVSSTKQVAQSASEASKSEADLSVVINANSGSLRKNIDQQINLEIELSRITKEQKELKAAFEAGTISEDKFAARSKTLAAAQSEVKNELTKSTLAIKQIQKETSSANTSYDAMQARLDRLRVGYRNLSAEERKSSDVGKVYLKNIKELDAELKNIDKDLGQFNKQVGNYGTKAIGAATTALVGFFAVNQIKNFVGEIFNVTAEFQKLESVLTNTLGSKSLAKKALDDIQLFAKTTPFGVQEVAGAFVKLANQGFVPTIDQLRKLGDLTASTGKTFDQLAEAVLDAQQGQFIRLREFGIRAEKDGDKVRLTFKGTTTEINNTADSIRNYIVGLGDLEGVSGAAAAVADTLGGKMSNLGDAFDQFLLKIGEGRLKPLFSGVVDGLTSLLNVSVDLVKTYDQRLDDVQQARISKDAESRKVANDKEIQDRVDQGEDLLKVQLEIYQREADLQDKLRQNDIQDLKIRNVQLLAEEKILSDERRSNGQTDRAREYSQKVSDSKLEVRRLEFDLKKRQFLYDDYNSKVSTALKQASAVDEDAAKKSRDAAYALAKQRLEISRDNASEIIKDEGSTLDSRIAAETVRYNKELALLKLTHKKELSEEGVQGDDITRLNEKYANDKDNATQKHADARFGIISKELQKEIEENDKYLKEEDRQNSVANKTALLAIETARDNELATVVGTSQESIDKRFDIEKKYTLQIIALQIDQTQALLDQYKIRSNGDVDSLNKIAEAEAQLAALRLKYGEEGDKQDTKSNKSKLKNLKKFLSEYGQAIGETFNLISQLSSNLYNSQIKEIQDAQDAGDKRYDREKTNIENSTLSEGDKKARLAILDQRKADQDAKLADRKKQADIAKAKRDKAIQIAQIIANTAIAVISQLSIPGAGFGLAAAAAAVGALQLATVLATPLPAYEKGGVHPKDGMALYGEKGSELYVAPDGSMGLTPATPTVGFVKGGTEFISNQDLKRMMANNTLGNFVERNSNGEVDFELSKLMANDDKNNMRLVQAVSRSNRTPVEKRPGYRTYK